MKSADPIIMYDSPEAAREVTITCWVARQGHYCGQGAAGEHQARWEGSTHRKCECGNVYPSRSWCVPCHNKQRRERWQAMPLVEWDGDCLLADFDGDQYWSTPDEFLEWCEDNEVDPADVMLVATEGQGMHEIDADTWWDDLPEDGELPGAVQNAVDALNEAIRKHGTVSWRPVDKRIVVASDLTPAREHA